MKLTLYFIVYCLLSLPFTLNAETLFSSYKNAQETYELKVSTSEVTTARGQELMINYSVYENKKFIHGSGYTGRFFSCNLRTPDIVPVNSISSQIGWMIIGYGICGNTMSHRIELVVPEKTYCTEYIAKTFISKEVPLVGKLTDGAELWFYEQHWGKGGTATSIFVPRKVVIDLRDYGVQIRKGDVLKNIDFLINNPPNKWLRPNFLGLFVAGLEDANPALMSYAIDKYYIESSELQDWVEGFGFDNKDKSYFLEKVKQVESLRLLHDEVEFAVSWDLKLHN